AAGALSVATCASATAATWSQGTQGLATGSDGPTEIAHEAAGPPRLAVADQLARPVAEAGHQQGNAALAQHAFQFRLTQAHAAIAQRQAARKRAAELAATNRAAELAATNRAAGKRTAELAASKQAAELAASKAVPAASGSP